jgi:hypothetical protein
MELKRIDTLSCARIAGVLYAAIGLVVGFFLSLAAVIGTALGQTSGDEPGSAVFGPLFGAGAIVIPPIFCGVLGFVSALAGAALDNATARSIGGVQLAPE